MRAAGRGPGASGKCIRALGKATRQLFPGATESLVSMEGKPPLGAVFPGPSLLSVSTPGADGHSALSLQVRQAFAYAVSSAWKSHSP